MVDHLRIVGTSLVGTAADGGALARLALGPGALDLNGARVRGLAPPADPDDAVSLRHLRDSGVTLPAPPDLASGRPDLDMAPVIQAALDAGRAVHLPAGDYYLSGRIYLRASLGGLFGPASRGACLWWRPGADPGDWTLVEAQADDCTVADLVLYDGCVRLTGNRGEVVRCVFSRMTVPAGDPPEVGAVYCWGVGHAVLDCQIVSRGRHAIVLDAGAHHRVRGNYLDASAFNGIAIVPYVRECIVTGNILHLLGLYAGGAPCTGVTVRGDGATVSHNLVMDDGNNAGVAVTGEAANVVVTANVVRRARCGVDVGAGAVGVEVVHNRFAECATDVALAAGATGVLVGPADPALTVRDDNPPLTNRSLGTLTWSATRTTRTSPATGDGTAVQVQFEALAGPSTAVWTNGNGDFVVPRAGVYCVTVAVQAVRAEGATADADELSVYLDHTDAAAEPPVAAVHAGHRVAPAPTDRLYCSLTEALVCAAGAVLRLRCAVRGSGALDFCVDAEGTRFQITHLG